METIKMLATSSEQLERSTINIPLEEFDEIVNSGKILVNDVREKDETRVVRVDAKSYLNISVKKLDEALKMDKDTFEMNYNRPKPIQTDQLAFICRSGRRSLTAIEIARANGFLRLHPITEGLQECILSLKVIE